MLKFSERLYRILLRLYPSTFRRDYGDLMAQVFRDQCRETVDQHGNLGLVGLWLHILADTLAAAFIEHRAAWKTRLALQTPLTYGFRHVILVLLPLIGIITYIYAVHDYRDMAIIYLLILATGAIAWVFNRLGLIPLNPLWSMYIVGILLGLSSIIFFFLSSLPAFGIFRLELPPIFILVTTLVIYVLAVQISFRAVGRLVRSYRMMAGLLAALTVIGFLIGPAFTYSDDTISRLISFNYSLMQTLAVLLTTAVSVALVHRWGNMGLIPLMLSVGVQFILIDPGYYTGYAGRWINLTALLFPLVICPAWWLLAQSRPTQIRGTLILWGILIAVVAFAPSIARVTILQLDYETPGIWAFSYFAAMWIALRSIGSNTNHTALIKTGDNPNITPVPTR